MRETSAVLAHMVGDYIVQTSWMANNKQDRISPAVAHAVTYTACFLPLTRRPRTLAIIGGTHFVIDHWRLARHLCWAKNQLAPKRYRYSWKENSRTGYPVEMPEWMSVWLMILADNTVHVAINAAALRLEEL